MNASKIAPVPGEVVPYHKGNYNGHPIIVLNPEYWRPFQFGIEKAKLILDNIEEIRQFVRDNS